MNYFFQKIILCFIYSSPLIANVEININSNNTLKHLSVNPTGLCFNFLYEQNKTDTQLYDTIKTLNLGSIRYPMGTLAENYFFHNIKYDIINDNLKPTIINKNLAPSKWKQYVNSNGSYKKNIVDLNEFILLCKKVETEPIIVLPTYDYKRKSSQYTKNHFIEHAKKFVEYTNKQKNYNIKYWEIGNEVDLQKIKKIMPKQEYLDLFYEISRAMKKIDPTIKVGLGIHAGKWGDITYLTDTLKKKKYKNIIDFVSVHQYSIDTITSYKKYIDYSDSIIPNILQVSNILNTYTTDKKLEILVTEFSSFLPGKKNISNERKKNNMFNALLTFDMLISGISTPYVTYMNFWILRNPWGKSNPNDYSNAISDKNELLLQGKVLKILGCFLENSFICSSSSHKHIKVWTSIDRKSSNMSIFILNKLNKDITININFKKVTTIDSYNILSIYTSNPNSSINKTQQKYLRRNQKSLKVRVPPLSINVIRNNKFKKCSFD